MYIIYNAAVAVGRRDGDASVLVVRVGLAGLAGLAPGSRPRGRERWGRGRDAGASWDGDVLRGRAGPSGAGGRGRAGGALNSLLTFISFSEGPRARPDPGTASCWPAPLTPCHGAAQHSRVQYRPGCPGSVPPGPARGRAEKGVRGGVAPSSLPALRCPRRFPCPGPAARGESSHCVDVAVLFPYEHFCSYY